MVLELIGTLRYKQDCHRAVMYNLKILFSVCYNNTFILCRRRKFGFCSFRVFKKLCNFTVLKIWQGFVILFKMNTGCQILELFNSVVFLTANTEPRHIF